MRAPKTRTLTRPALVLACVVLLAVVVTAGAGDLLGLRIDKRHHGKRPGSTSLSFTTGVLRQGRLGTWQLDDGTQLQLLPGLEWREEDTGEVGYPAGGRLVMITGQRIGGVLAVRQATLLSRERQVKMMQIVPDAVPDQREPQLPR
ncbi:MAG: hypothetical protein R3D98_16660 [Candidatus Krumholzibacteriia bacterium]